MLTIERNDEEPVSHDDLSQRERLSDDGLVSQPKPLSIDGLVSGMDAAHVRICADQRDLFSFIRAAEGRDELWMRDGARDLAHWLCMRYSISTWKAHRWIQAAHALQDLPRISQAFETGSLGVDKVVELTRFATSSTEQGLVRWATTVSGARIRRRAEVETRRGIEEDREARATRSLSMWFSDEHRRFHLEADLPAADGAVVAKAIRRQAEQVPHDPDAFSPGGSRLADGLVRICSGAIAADPDPDRATVVVHVQTEPIEETSSSDPEISASSIGLGVLRAEITSAEIEAGPVIHPVTASRLACDARIQVVVENLCGEPIAMGRTSRQPSAALMRQLRDRDRECTYPDCGATTFLVAHHLVLCSPEGPTDLDSMALDCILHHDFVHERGWSQRRDSSGRMLWFRPDGSLYVPGPTPTPAPIPEPLEIVRDLPETDVPQLPSRWARGP